MNKTTWKKVPFFSEKEFIPPDIGKRKISMNRAFVGSLVNARSQINRAITINHNGGYSFTGHSKNSLHYKGLAADIVIKKMDAFEASIAFHIANPRLSIGAYPYWNTQGLHVDSRYILKMPQVFWYRDTDDKYHYYQELHQMLRDLAYES